MLSKLSAELHKAAEKFKQIEDEKQAKVTKGELFKLQIATAARELEYFLQSEEGKSATEFLAISKQHINFGEERVGHGMREVVFIDGNGLHMSSEKVAYSDNVSKPTTSTISAEEAVMAAINYHKLIDPSEVLTKLKEKLLKMATSAPERHGPSLDS